MIFKFSDVDNKVKVKNGQLTQAVLGKNINENRQGEFLELGLSIVETCLDQLDILYSEANLQF